MDENKMSREKIIFEDIQFDLDRKPFSTGIKIEEGPQCKDCGEIFKTPKGLTVHRSKICGKVSKAKKTYISSRLTNRQQDILKNREKEEILISLTNQIDVKNEENKKLQEEIQSYKDVVDMYIKISDDLKECKRNYRLVISRLVNEIKHLQQEVNSS